MQVCESYRVLADLECGDYVETFELLKVRIELAGKMGLMYNNDRGRRQVRRPLFDFLPDRICDLGYSVIRLTHKAEGAFLGPSLSEVFHALWVLF